MLGRNVEQADSNSSVAGLLSRRVTRLGRLNRRYRPRLAACRMRPNPRHPQFFGQATAYRFLDDARAALNPCREETFPVRTA